MSFFDFFKGKPDPSNKVMNDPRFRHIIAKAEAEQTRVQCSNLRHVGRNNEATEIAQKFLAQLARDCLCPPHWESTGLVTSLTDASMELNEVGFGKKLVDAIIEFHENVQHKEQKPAPAIDLTQPYTDAGRLAHRIHGSREEEYRYFWFSTEAKPPAGCKEPASRRQKAIAHNFAFSLSSVEVFRDSNNEEEWHNRKVWHDIKRREFAPECNWGNELAMLSWLRGEIKPSAGAGAASRVPINAALFFGGLPEKSVNEILDSSLCMSVNDELIQGGRLQNLLRGRFPQMETTDLIRKAKSLMAGARDQKKREVLQIIYDLTGCRLTQHEEELFYNFLTVKQPQPGPLGINKNDSMVAAVDCEVEKDYDSEIDSHVHSAEFESNFGELLSTPSGVKLHGIVAGSFIMGSPETELGRIRWEKQVEVELSHGFWIAETPITQEQWSGVMGHNPSRFKGANLPVEQVAWYDAKDFCAKLTQIQKQAGTLPQGWCFDLPTEAEWEYACRAGTSSALNDGNELISASGSCSNLNEVAWYCGNRCPDGLPSLGPPVVRQKKPNAWGLYDMHGTISEWCFDWSDVKNRIGGVDPIGSATEGCRVIRGGNWTSPPSGCRSANSSGRSPDEGSFTLGFRPVLVRMRTW